MPLLWSTARQAEAEEEVTVMGVSGWVAKRMINAATNKAANRGATQRHCPNGRNGRHHWGKWFNEEHPNTGKIHGPGEFVVWHCTACGIVKK